METTDVERKFTFTVELSDEEVMLIASYMNANVDCLVEQACQDYPELEEYNPDAQKFYELWSQFDNIYEEYIKK